MFKNRLSYTVLLVGLVSIGFAGLLWLLVSLIQEDKRLLGELEDHGRLVVASVLQQSQFENVDWSDRATQRVLALGKVIGGVVLNDRGQSVRSFGEVPALSWIDVKQDGRTRERSLDWCCLDIYVDPNQSGLANPLILRLDASQVSNQVWNFGLRSILAAFFVICVFGFGLSVIMNRALTVPLRRVRDAALSAISDPGKAHQQRLHFKRSDELGELAGAIDGALEIIAVAHKQGLTEECAKTAPTTPLVLHYDGSHKLCRANEAALSFFGSKSVKELASRDEVLFRRDKAPIRAKINPKLASAADISVLGQAFGRGRPTHCLITTVSATTPRGGPNGRLIILTPTDEAQASMDATAADLVERRSSVVETRRELARTRQLLDCCMTLKNQILPKHTGDEPSPDIVGVRELLKSWSKVSIAEGLLRDDLRFGAVPDVYGPQDAIKMIFLSALAVVCERSRFTDPVINIRALVNDQRKACYVIEDVSSKQGRTDFRNPGEMRSWELPFAAFADVLTRNDGLLIEDENAADEDDNALSFSLPTPPKSAVKAQERERLRTSMRAA